ncbi:MAG: hypothetical protein B0D91_08655 [Oceanospirillales bacterium LUC14_002_19_P2]|nr:MAG: hypothetical protein B0D91_08655 [Oceanospirillales bacterium LUC14_002_19_P2]
MAQHLLLYASRDGQTEKIAHVIASELKQCGQTVECLSLEEGTAHFNLDQYDSILIGSPIRYGHHLPEVFDFIRQHETFLNQHPSGFFSVNLTARKPEKNRPETNSYLQKFLGKITWKPGMTGVMAGSLLYSRYRWFDRVMIQLIMKITGGNTDTSKDIEYTDWDAVQQFARKYSEYLKECTVSSDGSVRRSKPVDA